MHTEPTQTSSNLTIPRPSVIPFATIHPNHPDLIVHFGQRTFDAEGIEACGPHFSRVIHWPGGASGVTIGRGYDMGQRTRLQVASELVHAGMSDEDARFLSEAAGLRGEAARRFIARNIADSPVLSLAAQRRLFEDVTVIETISDIKRILAKPDLQERYGARTWDELTPMAREVTFDLRYRGDYTPEVRTRLQPLLVARDDLGLQALIAESGYWGGRNVPAERIRSRIEITTRYLPLRAAS